MRKANLSRVNAAALIASYANLNGADMSRADLTLGGLAEMKARGADLSGATMFIADVSGADLRNADLSGSNFAGGLAAGADLRGADLRGANLTIADLHRADLRGAKLAGATFCNTIMPSGRIRNQRRHCETPKGRAKGPAIEIPPALPIYTVVKAVGKPPTPPGERFGGCVVEPSTTCRARTSPGR